jgi:hypothetical protein
MMRRKAIPVDRALRPPIDRLSWAICAGLMLALVYAVAATSLQLSVDRDCKGGAFSSAFSSDFDIRRCSISIEHIPTGAKITVPLPGTWPAIHSLTHLLPLRSA